MHSKFYFVLLCEMFLKSQDLNQCQNVSDLLMFVDACFK